MRSRQADRAASPTAIPLGACSRPCRWPSPRRASPHPARGCAAAPSSCKPTAIRCRTSSDRLLRLCGEPQQRERRPIRPSSETGACGSAAAIAGREVALHLRLGPKLDPRRRRGLCVGIDPAPVIGLRSAEGLIHGRLPQCSALVGRRVRVMGRARAVRQRPSGGPGAPANSPTSARASPGTASAPARGRGCPTAAPALARRAHTGPLR